MQDYLAFEADLAHPDRMSAYDELPLWSAMFGLLLLDHIPLGKYMKVLDVGCGTGFPPDARQWPRVMRKPPAELKKFLSPYGLEVSRLFLAESQQVFELSWGQS